MDKKAHWEKVFAVKKQNEVSWFEPVPETSIDFFTSQNLDKDAHIIDVGSGDSFFIDYLIAAGYRNIHALDISESALMRLKERLGDKAKGVDFIVSDILDLKTDIRFDYWHDRAVFHFLKEKEDIERYVQLAGRMISDGGKMMVGTFSESGPLKCSGLEIRQYSQEELVRVFQEKFRKIRCINKEHATPFGTSQNFTFCSFKKAS